MATSLSKELRNLLARITLEARETAEGAAQSALENLAVHERDARPHMSNVQRALRNRLRARGRALGDDRDERTGVQEIKHLGEDIAYEHWHRLLFTRFLTENDLLHTDDSHGDVPVTLQECEELAGELGLSDGFEVAARFASRSLPGVFRPDDPVFDLTLAINDQVELRKLVDALPHDVFVADDALGWTYQFWQAKRKAEVNSSGKKIGADELAAVTQLFTEDYMVEFLLHNTIGAWWVGKHDPIDAPNEEEARAKSSLADKDGIGMRWTYLRLIRDERTSHWVPATGIYTGWPSRVRDVTLLDPCMGSGHFLVFALPILARIRMEEDGLTARDAIRAVLQENLWGLELDARCSQIAAFNICLTAWKLGGYQRLSGLHLACSGLAPSTTEKQWVALSGDDDVLQKGMLDLYSLFKDAPTLGSLINPKVVGRHLLEAKFNELQPLLAKLLKREKIDESRVELAATAQGLAKAADILVRRFTLVATNVPYLGRNKQDEVLQNYCDRFHAQAKADLATCFLERCLDFCHDAGTAAVVTPQNWLFLGKYKELRGRLLRAVRWDAVAVLGENGFESPQAAGAFAAMFCLSRVSPKEQQTFFGLDVSANAVPEEKAAGLRTNPTNLVAQRRQLTNPDARVTLETTSMGKLLSTYASSFVGLQNGDSPRFVMLFWEVPSISAPWQAFQLPCDDTTFYGGRQGILKWDGGTGELAQFEGCYIKGREAWGKVGVAVRHMRELPVTLYSGDLYDQNSAAIIPKDPAHLPAIWSFLSSDEFNASVRKVDRAIKVTNATLVKVQFDLDRWQKVARTNFPQGLPRPSSSDPTQWLSTGHPHGSDRPLQVAVARLLGYRWPRQTGSKFRDCSALQSDGLEDVVDSDGIVCLAAINRELSAATRLRRLLTQALQRYDERALLTTEESATRTIEEWLRDEFFERHVELFGRRPYVWHVWDGRTDGFHALVNYHKLDRDNLQKLAYSHLGDWIRTQQDGVSAGKAGADARLGAARELQSALGKILEGEAPYDVFVRWKAVSRQAVGWNPDLNDGVRLNIRPFIEAGVLRKRVGISWEKDRGKEPHRTKDEYPWFWCENDPGTDPVGGRKFVGHRWNDVHLSLERKREARRKATS